MMEGRGYSVVVHRDDQGVLRPDKPIVMWVGRAFPLNAEPHDLWHVPADVV